MDPRARLAGWEAGPRAALGRGKIRQEPGRGGGFAQPVCGQEQEGGLESCILPPAPGVPSASEDIPCWHSGTVTAVVAAGWLLFQGGSQEPSLAPQLGCGAKILGTGHGSITQLVLGLHMSPVPISARVPMSGHVTVSAQQALGPGVSPHITLHPPWPWG